MDTVQLISSSLIRSNLIAVLMSYMEMIMRKPIMIDDNNATKINNSHLTIKQHERLSPFLNIGSTSCGGSLVYDEHGDGCFSLFACHKLDQSDSKLDSMSA